MFLKKFYLLCFLLFFSTTSLGADRIKSITFGAMLLDRDKFGLIDANLDRIKSNNFNSITLIVNWYVNNYLDPQNIATLSRCTIS